MHRFYSCSKLTLPQQRGGTVGLVRWSSRVGGIYNGCRGVTTYAELESMATRVTDLRFGDLRRFVSELLMFRL